MATKAVVAAQTQVPTIISISVVFVVASTGVVLLRLLTRAAIVKIVGPDDITIGIAQVLSIATSIITILEAVYGLGRHSWVVNPDSTIKQLKCLYANVLIYNAAQITVKISLLMLFRRIFPSRTMQRVCLGLLVFIIAWGISQEVIAGLACSPLSTIIPGMAGRCISTLPVWYLTSSMNIATDFIVFAVPLPAVLRLQMRRRQKVLLFSLFSLGFFTCVISLIRMSTLHKGVHTTDPMWDNAPTAYWSIVELNCGILCASLPTLRPFISKFIPHILSTHGATNNQTANTMRPITPADANRIYIMKEVEQHSTTELRRSETEAYPASLEDGLSCHDSTHHVEVST